MGFKLGKTLKNVATAPFGGSKIFDKMSRPIFGGSQSNPNAYTAPDIDFLREAAPSVNYDFLRTPTNLTGGFKSYQDFLRPTNPTSTGAFQSYINNINAPSSVDAVRGELNNDRLNSTLDSIYRDTRGKFGEDLMASFGKGIFDPSTGADSDIARNSMAQVAASGARTAADARTSLGLGDIERLAGRESAAREAYGQNFNAANAIDLQGNQLAASGATSDAGLWAGLLGKEGDINFSRDAAFASGQASNADREAARRKQLADALMGISSNQADNPKNVRDPGILRKILDNVQIKFGK